MVGCRIVKAPYDQARVWLSSFLEVFVTVSFGVPTKSLKVITRNGKYSSVSESLLPWLRFIRSFVLKLNRQRPYHHSTSVPTWSGNETTPRRWTVEICKSSDFHVFCVYLFIFFHKQHNIFIRLLSSLLLFIILYTMLLVCLCISLAAHILLSSSIHFFF